MASNTRTIKELSEAGKLSSLPHFYASRDPNADELEPVGEEEVPVIDYSLLVGGNSDQRDSVVRDLGRACQDWGFFLVVNHGVEESLRAAMVDAGERFFEMTTEEKIEYAGKHVLDPIRCGTSFNTSVEEVRYWRDFLKVIVHPEFHSPAEPACFRSTSQRTRRAPPDCLIAKAISIAEKELVFLMASDTRTIKELSEAGKLSSLPHFYASRDPNADELEPVGEEEAPVIDYSLLVGGNSDQRASVVRDLGRACQDWGFFLVVNHGVEESLRAAMLDAGERFFEMTTEEKMEYAGKHVLDPIRCGTSFNTSVEEVRYWRDFLKIFVHPEFHSPASPACFRETCMQYTACTREMAKELLRAAWESLQLEPDSMDKTLKLDSCFQILIVNLYPPCPQPELAMGLPPHSDHGLLTVLLDNGVSGLQVKHNGRWVPIKAPPNSFVVNTGDHMEIVSNGRYKSVLHRAEVNGRRMRMSVATTVGSSLDTVVAPAAELADGDGRFPAFKGMKYRDFMEFQQGNRLKDKSVLDLLRLRPQ